jgi:phosphatidylserine/phosphatidylglycerophosphate/cardiolipin synthase-like enzyme
MFIMGDGISPIVTQSTHEDDVFWVSGDFPPREGVLIHPLVDGRAAMLAMCRAFLSARDYILLAGWDIRADMLMVRGSDVRMGPDGSPEQEKFLAGLREEGLSDEALALWTDGRLRVSEVLGFAARQGVKVGVLLWDAPSIAMRITNNPGEQRKALEEVGVDCVLDASSRKLPHLLEALHQKCAVVDGKIAFVGGVDLTLQADGDYDRWDTHAHPPETRERGSAWQVSMHPWHDAHIRIQGPAVTDIQRNIVQRWTDVIQREGGPDWPVSLPSESAIAHEGGVKAQIVRTIPPDTYSFSPGGIKTVYEAYMRATNAAQRYIYLESQYFWPEVYRGLDSLLWGGRSAEMSGFITALANALNRGVHVCLVIPDHPNCGRRYSDAGIALLNEQAPEAVSSGRLRVYTLGASHLDTNAPGGVLYRPIYVHAKVAIVDDRWLTIGSANLNNRGFLNDAELNVAIANPQAAADLRVSLWTEHLLARVEDAAILLDIKQGLEALDQQAQENFARVIRREPLQGHLLPYIRFERAKEMGVPVHPEHGWLDSIEGGLGATPETYRDRYL